MNLKKNDKIILIVGVVILIVAGVGIALYSAPESDEDVGEPTDEKTQYTYSWEEMKGKTVIGENLFAGKDSPWQDTVTITSESNTILTNIEFNIVWSDDSTYGLLVKRGEDTLSGTISLEEEDSEEAITVSTTGSGNHSYFFNVNTRPEDGSVPAEDSTEARTKINAMTKNMNDASFDVRVSVQTGEKFWHILHLLKVIREKGNNFELTATYTYYEYTLDETDDSPDDDDNGSDNNKTTGSSFNHHVGEFYVNLGYGRGMI